MQDTLETSTSFRDDESVKAPKVSVILSVYNAQAYLAEAIDSVLSQTAQDFELIIVDDGSSDDSGSILDRYAHVDPRVRLIRRENRGLTVSLNEGLSSARGELVARMDADDICEPERLARQSAYMDAHPGISAVGCAIRYMDGEGRLGDVARFPTDHAGIEAELWRGNGMVISHPALMARRSAMQSIGGYDEQYRTAQDLDLYLRLGEVGQLSNLDTVLLRYRRHPDAVGMSKFEQQDRDVWNMLNAALARRGIKKPPRFYESRWEYRRMMAVSFGSKGYYFTALKHASRAFYYKPCSVRTLLTVVIALLGSVAARRWINRTKKRHSMSM